MAGPKKTQKSSAAHPVLLMANEAGEIFDDPRYGAAGMSGGDVVPLAPEDLVPLPDGSKFYFIPKGRPLGFTAKGGPVIIDGAYAVAAFLPPGYTRTYLPAYEEFRSDPILPLWSYTAVAWYRDNFYAAAVQVAWMKKADPHLHDDDIIGPLVQKKLARFPGNRLLRHLEKCAMFYHCFAAKNIFVGRWEAPLPSSPICNARCIGCLSLQEGECCASQDRIQFVPTPQELAEAAIPHLKKADDAIVSFGQGCEGEPLLQATTLAKAVTLMRASTKRGIVNLNTNGFSPDRIESMAKAGLDSIRISLNSPDRDRYNQYYRPKGYRFENVIESIGRAKKLGLFTSINYLVFPGYTDREQEVDTLKALIAATGIDQVQMRNLSLDPSLYLQSVTRPKGRAIGIRTLVEELRKEFPRTVVGYFNLPKADIRASRKESGKG